MGGLLPEWFGAARAARSGTPRQCAHVRRAVEATPTNKDAADTFAYIASATWLNATARETRGNVSRGWDGIPLTDARCAFDALISSG